MARALVADMFAHYQTCALRDCRAAGSCQAWCEGGFCPVGMDSRQALVFVGMMAFHDVLSSEALGCEPVEAS
ncbi:hypothetical protein [Mesorhizobium sp. Root157]|uniref:hypothetical protein n=1 Tax=Mesorhizobium sp. Root157 TaxID=1736477 RepID=UPI0012E38B3D|nr:hypothetical protein [Mesorhizobium sp. Root157]